MFKDDGCAFPILDPTQRKSIEYRARLERRIRKIKLGAPVLLYGRKGYWKKQTLLLRPSDIQSHELMKDTVQRYRTNIGLGKALLERDSANYSPDFIDTEEGVHIFSKGSYQFYPTYDRFEPGTEIYVTDMSTRIITGAENIYKQILKVVEKTTSENLTVIEKLRDEMLLEERMTQAKDEYAQEMAKEVREYTPGSGENDSRQNYY